MQALASAMEDLLHGDSLNGTLDAAVPKAMACAVRQKHACKQGWFVLALATCTHHGCKSECIGTSLACLHLHVAKRSVEPHHHMDATLVKKSGRPALAGPKVASERPRACVWRQVLELVGAEAALAGMTSPAQVAPRNLAWLPRLTGL